VKIKVKIIKFADSFCIFFGLKTENQILKVKNSSEIVPPRVSSWKQMQNVPAERATSLWKGLK